MRLFKPLCSALAALGMSAAATADPEKSVSFEAELERPVLARGYDGPVHVLVTLKAPEITRPDKDRPKLNLAMVLDRSGSMAEAGKITHLRDAAHLGVDLLSGKDELALIKYDDRIEVMRKLGPVTDKAAIKKDISALMPGGSTNLTGGMMAGVEQLTLAAKRSDSATVTRVLLLSDGLANQGVTDPEQIKARVRDAKHAGIRITTLGLGRDYDEDLMQMIAEQGGGAYYYIEHPRQMVRIFEEEMSSLFATVATGVTLAFDKSEAVEKAELVSISEGAQDATSLALPDFYAGEERTVLLRLTLKEAVSDAELKLALGALTLTATQVETGEVLTDTLALSADTTLSVAAADAARNKAVAVEAALLKAEQDNRAALAAYEAGDRTKADQIIVTAQKRLADDAFVADDDRVKAKGEALEVEQQDMAEFASAPAASAAYVKRSKQRLYKAQKGDRKGFVMSSSASGLEVERLQQKLKDGGFYTGDITGDYDAETEKAVKAYQAANGLEDDGVAGPATQKSLGLY